MTNITRDLDAIALEGLKALHDWKSLDEGVASLIVAAFAPDFSGMFTMPIHRPPLFPNHISWSH